MTKNGFTIDLTEEFEHLSNAPIVEAVIHWRAHPQVKLEPEELLPRLKERLPDYPDPQQQQEVHMGGEIGPDGASVQQKQIWHGFRLQSEDKKCVAQFTRNGLVFSRLKPYESWPKFEEESLRLWEIYRDIAQPPEIQRLGVRYINILRLTQLDELGKILVSPPALPNAMELPLTAFMHQTRFAFPGHEYELNVIQTVQPPSPVTGKDLGLILDLGVFTTDSVLDGKESLEKRMTEMRWIKNKAFFSFLTKNAIDELRE